jgi:rhodanese-related sulfurtransferase
MEISVTALYEQVLKEEELVWIDVRRCEEFKSERPNSGAVKNIPLDQITTLDLPKDQQIFLSCLSGRRSQAAKDLLIARGFTNVVNVTGGFVAWQDAGLPVHN